MAHGAYLGDGRVQAVMLHTSVGTANAVCGALNAATDRIPILLTAGRSPLFEDSVLGSRDGGIHWAQEMYDQASMVRELVKWDYELRDGVQVAAVVDRAIDIAMTMPRAPVYLSLPREVLARNAHGDVPPPRSATPSDAAPSADTVGRRADLLAASFPVFVTAASGTDPATATLLGQLCDEYSIGVLESGSRRYNVAASHPLHLGYDLRAAADADVLCSLTWTCRGSPRGPRRRTTPSSYSAGRIRTSPGTRFAPTGRTCRSPPASGTFSRPWRRPCPDEAPG